MDIQQKIDEAVEEFRKKVEEILNPLSDTQFRCVDSNGKVVVMDALSVAPGTTILIDDWEVFRTINAPEHNPWVDFMGKTYTSVEFVKMLQNQPHTHRGLCIRGCDERTEQAVL